MPLRIGRAIKMGLPPDQRDGIEDFLLAKSSGEKCHLCETDLNLASELVEADHDDPSVLGGPTTRENLWLAHATCNWTKKENPTVEVRPYLKLKQFLASHSNVLRYDGVLEHFSIDPQPCRFDDLGDRAEFSFSDGTKSEVPVFSDVNKASRDFRYAFVRVPKEALFNDDEVQPRSLKLGQVWAIYGDLQINPLHEPPSCRLISLGHGMYKLALFDGQHKTVASWMAGNSFVTVKVYIDLTAQEANYLVNSIQAKIKKLPLSPFELSAKLSDEWTARLEEYRGHVAADEASEAGFISFVSRSERARAKSAFEAALVEAILEMPELALRQFVHLAGQPQSPKSLITETQFNNKVLKKLLHTSPLSEVGVLGEELRGRERENIVRALNVLEELVFEPTSGALELTQAELERRRRLLYQSSLAYVAELIKSLHGNVLGIERDRAFMEKSPSEDDEQKIREGIRRIVEHPIWFADFDLGPKTIAIREALSKNQDVTASFQAVGLRLGYVLGIDELPNLWYA